MQQTLQAQAYINHFDTANLIYFENARVEDVWEKDGEVYFSLSDFANRLLDGFVGDLRDRELEFFEDKFLHNVIESEYGQFSLWIDYSKSSLKVGKFRNFPLRIHSKMLDSVPINLGGNSSINYALYDSFIVIKYYIPYDTIIHYHYFNVHEHKFTKHVELHHLEASLSTNFAQSNDSTYYLQSLPTNYKLQFSDNEVISIEPVTEPWVDSILTQGNGDILYHEGYIYSIARAGGLLGDLAQIILFKFDEELNVIKKIWKPLSTELEDFPGVKRSMQIVDDSILLFVGVNDVYLLGNKPNGNCEIFIGTCNLDLDKLTLKRYIFEKEHYIYGMRRIKDKIYIYGHLFDEEHRAPVTPGWPFLYAFDDPLVTSSIDHSLQYLNLEVFPNPTADRLFFKNLPASWNEYKVSVYDALGRHIVFPMDLQNHSIDCSLLPPGTYQLVLTKGMQAFRTSFIKL